MMKENDAKTKQKNPSLFQINNKESGYVYATCDFC